MFTITYVILGLVFRLSFIPTGSMEPNTLKVGDKVVIWKMAYGARTPETVIQIPFLEKKYYKHLKLPYFRLPGYTKPKRFDVFIFNSPYEVMQHNRDMAQPFVKRLKVMPGETFKRVNGKIYIKQKDGTFQPQTLPTHVVMNKKYMVMLPLKRFRSIRKEEEFFSKMEVTDTLRVNESTYLISATEAQYKALSESKDVQKIRQYHMPMPIEGYQTTFKQLDTKAEIEDYIESQGIYAYKYIKDNTYLLQASKKQIENLEQDKKVKKIVKIAKKRQYFNYSEDEEENKYLKFSECMGGNQDQLPEITVPKKGMVIPITKENLKIYAHVILHHDNAYSKDVPNIDEEKGTLTINGVEQREYTFKQNYYWGEGDNAPGSADSRSWGFIPYDLVIGKATLVVVSNKNKYFITDLFAFQIRGNRILMPVNKGMWGISAMHLRAMAMLLLFIFCLGIFFKRKRRKKKQ